MKTGRFVTPEGTLEVQPKKLGLLMGNRGVLGPKHYANPQPYQPGKPWIFCILKEGGVPLPKTYTRYTKLFFIDEVTALAAGHRPCGQCQKSRYNLFASSWAKCFNNKNFDAVLRQEERLNADGTKKTFTSKLADLPNGVLVKVNELRSPCLFFQGRLFPWTIDGYLAPVSLPIASEVQVLTPKSIVQLLEAGFPLMEGEEAIHPSLFALLS